MRRRDWAFAFTIMSLCLIMSSGCYEMKEFEIDISYSKDLSGDVTVKYVDLISTAKTEKKRKEAMKKLYEKDYKEHVRQLGDQWDMEEPKVTWHKKEELVCTVSVTGSFRSSLSPIKVLAHDRTYSVQNTKDSFSVKIDSFEEDKKDEDLSGVFVVKLRAKNMVSNAPVKRDGVHMWDYDSFVQKGMQFEIKKEAVE